MKHMYELRGIGAIISLSLMYYEEIIRGNIKKTIRTAENPERLRSHIKSHESMDMVQMQTEYGTVKFKMAMVAEVEMAAMAGAERVILTYPPISPDMERFAKLTKACLDIVFHGVEDNRAQLEAPSRVCVGHDVILLILVGVNMGINRTGVPIEGLERLYHFAYSLPGLRLCGMRRYDEDHNNKDTTVKQAGVGDTDRRVANIMERLTGDGICRELAVAGGIPSFPCHVGCTRWYLFPGTVPITDAGYYMDLPDLDFIPDAAVMTRVISHPAKGVFTTDLGYKATAPDPAGQRDFTVGLGDAVPITHSEKHQAFRLEDRSRIPVIGTCLYAIPIHTCPAMALYPRILVAEEGRAAAGWRVTARNRKIIY